MSSQKILLVLFALVVLGTATKCPKKKTSPLREILCYTSAFKVQLLADSVCSCTTLVYQNYDVRNLSISDITDLRISLKEMYPSLQFIISIFDPAKTLVSSAMVRQEALARIISVIKEVDGVEMNVTAGSKERLYNFVKSLKNEMIRKSYDKRIFLSLPTKSEDIAKQFDLKRLAKYVDVFTLPTDYLTDEDSAFLTFHPSRLMGLFDMLNPDSLIDLLSELGVPKQKIVMALPANAYKFALKNESENAPRSETLEKEPVSIDRKQFCEIMKNGNWTVERDEDLTAPYAFQAKTWIAFEDKISVGIKGKYALLRDLAGLAVRNIESDMKTECENPLTQEIYRSFTEFKRKSRQAVLNALEDELHQTQFSYPNQATTSNFRVVRVVDTEGHIRAVRENTQTEFVCRRQGYFVHPKSCNRFYRCVKFNQAVEDYSVFEFDCPAGLSFDERTEVCVWPGSLPQGSPCPGSSEIAPVAPKRFECSKSGYYADPQNCRWFFACMDLGGPELMAFEFRCPYGLVFDEQKLVCEWPWLVPACSESGSVYTRSEYDYGGHSTGTSHGFGVGGYVTGGLPEYSVTAGTDYSNVDYSKTTNTGGVNYFGSTTGHIGGLAGISASVGLSHGQTNIDYTQSSGYEGSVSSIPTYSKSSDIHIDSIFPGTISKEQGNTRFSTSGNEISSGHTISADQIGAGYANTGLLGESATSFSRSTVQGYTGNINGSHYSLSDNVPSGVPISSYPAVGGYIGSVSVNPLVDTVGHSKPGNTFTTYFESTRPSVDVHVGSSKYADSSLHTDSGIFNSGDHTTINVYSGVTERQQPSHGATGLLFRADSYPGTIGGIGVTGSINKEYTGSNTQLYGDTSISGYSKAMGASSSTGFGVNLSPNSEIHSTLQSSTSSGRVTDSISGSSKKYGLTSGISTILGHSGSTTADSSHFVGGSTASSGAIDTKIKYNNEDGYTIPVFIQHELYEPIYPLPGTGVRDHTRTTGVDEISVISGKINTARPNLNISIFGNEIPTGYDVQKGTTILTGNSIQGSIVTGDSFSEIASSYGNIPGAVSTSSINQGTILTEGTKSGYVVTSSGTPEHVIRDELKTVDSGLSNLGTLTYGTPTPAISDLSRPSTVLKYDIIPDVIFGQTTPKVPVGYSTQPGVVKSSTGPQPGIIYHNIDSINTSAEGSVTSSNIQSGGILSTNLRDYKTDKDRSTATLNVAYDTSKYSEKDIPDYRPTSATLPDSIVSGGRIEGAIINSTLASGRVVTDVSGYSQTKSAVFTPSGFTKTGPTRTGITTAILGGGGSYSVSTGDRRPILNPENISEKAFEGNVAGYTKTSNSDVSVSATLIPPSYFSTATPSSSISQSIPFGYSYPKPTVQLGTSGITFSSSPISSTRDHLPVTTPTPFVEINRSSDNVFESKIPTVSTDRRVSTSTIRPTIYTTKYPDIYKSTLFEAAKIPSFVTTVKPTTNIDYKTMIPTNIPVSVLTDDRFIQRTGSSQTGSIATSSIDKVPSGRPDFSVLTGQKDYSSPSLSSEYLPAKSNKSGTFTTKYNISAVTPQLDLGVTYKKPSLTTYKKPSSIISPTTFRPDFYYSGQGFTFPSSVETTPSSGSPTNLHISRDKIDKLITNYNRGTVKYTPSVYDDFTSLGFGSTKSFSSSSSSSSTKSLFSEVKTGGTFAAPGFTPVSSYEVTTKSPEDKGKIIVKWSDLHPLLLGKLGAECTCKADPFATLRGPVRKLIDSSRGKVDLANYDESEIYVDLENDSGSKESDYIIDYDYSSPQPYKLSPLKTTSITTGSTKLLSSSYLPASSTTIRSRDFVPPVDIRTGISGRADGRESSQLQIGVRTGKKLTNISPLSSTTTSNKEEEEEEEEEDPDQIIDGVTDCARPGLFRHPSLCNKFYACYWDQWKKKFTLHIFNCPIHLTFDSNAGACNWPSKGPACQADNLLV